MARPAYSLLRKLRRVLIHCIGDTQVCPNCQHHFIPQDQTQRDTIAFYNEIFGPFRKVKK